MPFWIFLNDSEGSLFVDHLRVALSGRIASAATRAWEPDGSGRAPEQMRLTSLESFLEIYRLPGLPQGRPAPYAQWEYLDLEDRDLLSFTVEDDTVIIRREDVCHNCAEGKEEAFEDFFDRLPVELQQQLVTKLAKRLLKNQRGAAYGRH